MPKTDFKIKTADGLKLQGTEWMADSAPRAVVLLIHGLGEHCGRYSHVADAFNEAGFAMFAFDLRGHGKSEGKRGHAANYDVLMNDIFLCLKTIRERYPDLPIFLYGHSLGGNLVIHYALKKQPTIAGVIATAPLFRLAYKPPFLQTLMLKIFKSLRINISLPSGLDDTALSRDVNVIRAYRNDPLTHNRITPALAVNMIKFGEWNLEHSAELSLPFLLMHGDADRITSSEASREFAEKSGKNCTLKIWQDLFHEPHNEPEKRDVVAFAIDWLHFQIMH